MITLKDFADFISDMEDDGIGKVSKDRRFFYTKTLIAPDIAKELDKTNKTLSIVNQGRFWTVAKFPIEYNAIPLKILGKVLWPDEKLDVQPDVTER